MEMSRKTRRPILGTGLAVLVRVGLIGALSDSVMAHAESGSTYNSISCEGPSENGAISVVGGIPGVEFALDLDVRVGGELPSHLTDDEFTVFLSSNAKERVFAITIVRSGDLVPVLSMYGIPKSFKVSRVSKFTRKVEFQANLSFLRKHPLKAEAEHGRQGRIEGIKLRCILDDGT